VGIDKAHERGARAADRVTEPWCAVVIRSARRRARIRPPPTTASTAGVRSALRMSGVAAGGPNALIRDTALQRPVSWGVWLARIRWLRQGPASSVLLEGGIGR
jgi:hypothetical protein